MIVIEYNIYGLGIDFLYLFLIHLSDGLPLDFHSRSDLSPWNAEVARKNHPLLDLLGIADRFSVSRVDAFLDASHNIGIGTAEDIFDSVCIAAD